MLDGKHIGNLASNAREKSTMPTGKESVEELLARWADLLRSRHGIMSRSGSAYCIRYYTGLSGKIDWQEYQCQSSDTEIINGLHALFLKDIDDCIGQVEADLAKQGVIVARPVRPSS